MYATHMNSNNTASSSILKNSRKSLVGVIQITSSNDIDDNYLKIKELIQTCVERGAKLICLPENFAYMAAQSSDSVKISEPLDGPLLQRYRDLAKEQQVWLSLGGFQEKIPDNSAKRYNTHVIVNDQGDIVSAYRKLHLFDIDLTKHGGVAMSESEFVQKGMELPQVVETPFGNVGPTICYDIRFPELYRHLFQQNAQLILIPAAFTVKTGASHWESMLRCRAIENQCYVIASAQTGMHADKRATYGHSMVVDPWGDIIGQMSDKEGCFVCEIDLEYLDKVRGNMACLTHMRKDVLV